MQITADIELLVDGIALRFVPHKPTQDVIDAITWQYIDLAGSDVDVAHYDDDVVFTHRGFAVVGIPVPITPAQAATLRAMQFVRGQEVEVFDPTGDGIEFYVLSASGSRRVAANVRSRYVVAKRLGCSPVAVEGGIVWKGRHVFTVEDPSND